MFSLAGTTGQSNSFALRTPPFSADKVLLSANVNPPADGPVSLTPAYRQAGPSPFEPVARKKTPLRVFSLAGTTGLEPATYCVTGSRSNQLSYAPVFCFLLVAGARLELATSAL